jgi:hypothetical protein
MGVCPHARAVELNITPHKILADQPQRFIKSSSNNILGMAGSSALRLEPVQLGWNNNLRQNRRTCLALETNPIMGPVAERPLLAGTAPAQRDRRLARKIPVLSICVRQ